MKKNNNFMVKLGLFVVVGMLLFIGGIYYLGKNQNLFGESFIVKGIFNNVGGLQVGNNVRFSGINVGTVENIQIISDTSVLVSLLIEADVRPYIKKDAKASIGSEGLMGNKVINIIAGTLTNKPVDNQDTLLTVKPLEIDEIIQSVKSTAMNAQVITGDLAYLTTNMRKGRGMIGKLFTDTVFAKNIDRTIANMKKGTQGFSENMEAAKESFLLKPLFKKKKKKGDDDDSEAEDKNKTEDNKEKK
jgi:phospholipid/cholesterol/gamma-HCH transport system substrate-binding protein